MANSSKMLPPGEKWDGQRPVPGAFGKRLKKEKQRAPLPIEVAVRAHGGHFEGKAAFLHRFHAWLRERRSQRRSRQ